ncbi:hypothetical protein ACVXHB_31125 [Escherichia coli]
MAEEGLPPKEATRKSMGSIRALWSVSRLYGLCIISYRWPSLAVDLVLSIVKSITIVSAMALSVLVALIRDSSSLCDHAKPIAKGVTGKVKKASSLV